MADVIRQFRDVLQGKTIADLERALPGYLVSSRWFRSKALSVKAARVADVLPVSNGSGIHLALIDVDHTNGERETYILPLALATRQEAQRVRSQWPERVLAEMRIPDSDGSAAGVLYDAVLEPAFSLGLLDMIAGRRRVKGSGGEMIACPTDRFEELGGLEAQRFEPRVLKGEQSNTSVTFHDRLILKMFRRLDPGINPEVDIGRFLTKRHPSVHVAPMAGWIDFQSKGETSNLAILQVFVPNRGDAWQYTLKELDDYFTRVDAGAPPPPLPDLSLYELAERETPDPAGARLIGTYLHAARLLGQRVAELHLALLDGGDDPEFAAEPYSREFQRTDFESMRALLTQVLALLKSHLSVFPKDLRAEASILLACEAEIARRFEAFAECRPGVARMRCHGDLHLGQVLCTPDDFVIIDFEGEPARPLAERRRKRVALRDVAGMLRSFHYAALSSMIDQSAGARQRIDPATLLAWANLWQMWSSWAFMRGYLRTVATAAAIVPASREDLRITLDAFLMEKAIYEVGYELNNRPTWLRVPLQGVAQILGIRPASAQS
jgi:trehalose synthase-fused probable maltokinase